MRTKKKKETKQELTEEELEKQKLEIEFEEYMDKFRDLFERENLNSKITGTNFLLYKILKTLERMSYDLDNLRETLTYA